MSVAAEYPWFGLSSGLPEAVDLSRMGFGQVDFIPAVQQLVAPGCRDREFERMVSARDALGLEIDGYIEVRAGPAMRADASCKPRECPSRRRPSGELAL